jgi:UDP-perosamine 4-acetyltransferase
MAGAKDRYLVVGAGGHARVVADLVRATGGVITGYIGRGEADVGTCVDPHGGMIVTSDSLALDYCEERHVDAIALGIGDNALRVEAAERLASRLARPLFHPTAIVSPSAKFGPGTVVLAGTIVNAGTVVGAAVILNTGCLIEHDCVIDDGAHISPGAVLTAEVRVGRSAWVGAGATVLPRLGIGPWAVVGGGAVVVHEVLEGTTVVGVPARPLTRDVDL